MALGEGAVGVTVDWEPLVGIKQLHQQRRVGAPACDVCWSQETLGILVDGIAKQTAILERRQAGAITAEDAGRRAYPVLRRKGVGEWDAAKLGDPRAASVEAMEIVGREAE